MPLPIPEPPPVGILKRLEKDAIPFLAPHDLRAAFDSRIGHVSRSKALRDLMQQAVDGVIRFTWEKDDGGQAR